MRGSCDTGGVTDGSRLAIPSLASAPLRVGRVRVCAMHPFLFDGLPARLCTLPILSGICFLCFLFVSSFFNVVFASFFVIYALVGALYIFSDHFLSSTSHTGLATAYITGYGCGPIAYVRYVRNQSISQSIRSKSLQKKPRLDYGMQWYART